jgi:hypothetical protein
METDYQYLALQLSKARQFGQTTALVEIAKRSGAIILCANHRHAADVERTHGVRTMTVGDCLRGLDGPMLLDHFAAGTLLYAAGAEIDRLRSEIAQLRAAIVEAGRCRECEGRGSITLHDQVEERGEWVEVEVGTAACPDCEGTGIPAHLSPATQAVVARAKEEVERG